MAGTLKVKNLQLGDNATATQNFVWTENSDGTAKLSRGNVGATTQDILTVDATGGVKFPQNVVVFRAGAAVGISIPPGLGGSTVFTSYSATGTVNEGAGLNLTTGRFQPTVAGYYSISNLVAYTSVGITASYVTASILKNGAEVELTSTPSAGSLGYPIIQVSTTMYLNGTTDYVSGGTKHNAAGSISDVGCQFQGFLIARA